MDLDPVYLDDDEIRSLDSVNLDPGLRRWLTCDGLLTERLQRLPGVRLEVLAETDVRLTPRQRHLVGTRDTSGRLREISLQSGDTRYVFATSLIPDSLVRTYAWLEELGEQPLGATLTAHLKVPRSKFRFRKLAADEPLAEQAAVEGNCGPLWSRQSTFQLPDGLILVSEVFLPALAPRPIS
jgi:chorismate-pyruvate lyase